MRDVVSKDFDGKRSCPKEPTFSKKQTRWDPVLLTSENTNLCGIMHPSDSPVETDQTVLTHDARELSPSALNSSVSSYTVSQTEANVMKYQT